MIDVVRFGVLGVGAGAMYALLAQGLVLIYRGSGVINLAQGAIGLSGAYCFYELRVNAGFGFLLAFVLSLAFATLLGAATHLLVMHRLRNTSGVVKMVATLGVLVTLQAIMVLRYAAFTTSVPSPFPQNVVTLAHTDPPIAIGADRLFLLGIAIVVTVGLHFVYRSSLFGLATSGVAENQRAAAALGWSPAWIACLNWMAGSALGALAAIFAVTITGLQASLATTLVVVALAAALVGNLASFPIALAVGLAMGVGQAEITRFAASTVGLNESLPFLVVVFVVVFRGRALPLRGTLLNRLPEVGSARLSTRGIVIVAVLVATYIVLADDSWAAGASTSLGGAMVLLSLVVVLGYAGQLSLAQFALAGVGALFCSRLDAGLGLPLPLAFVLAVLGAVVAGALLALPAVRTRGVNLAIVTLGLATAIGAMVFNNVDLTGGQVTTISHPHFLGWQFDAHNHPKRYLLVCLFCLVLAGSVVANLRRGRVGRRLLAIRTNERAASALGINVVAGKVYAFAISAGIAATGGILLAYRTEYAVFGEFADPVRSVQSVAFAVIGGIGFISTVVFGSPLWVGGIGATIGDKVFSQGFRDYLPLVGGVVFLFMILQDPDGAVAAHIRAFRRASDGLRGLIGRTRGDAVPSPVAVAATTSGEPQRLPIVAQPRIEPMVLEVREATVRYGGVTALEGVSLRVETGRILGLIGPNGAGKTTLIDAVTGFVRLSQGDLLLDGQSIAAKPPYWRARRGLSRSFQSLELFEDMSVEENLLAASEPRDALAYMTTLVWPKKPRLPENVEWAVREFELASDLQRKVKDLSYGRRRLVAIARAVAVGPSILFLDEPAAGLSDQESRELSHLLRRLVERQRLGILLVEHDMTFAMGLCDEFVVLDFGRSIAHGTPETVRRDPVVIAAYLGQQPDEELIVQEAH